MANVPPKTRAQTLTDLKKQAEKLHAEVLGLNTAPAVIEPIRITVEKSDAHFRKLMNPRGDDLGLGSYFLLLDVTAGKDTLHIPTSIASGRKSAGFIYQIEGTASGTATAAATFKGEGTMIVTSGSISYCKIPPGKTATFKILAEITGSLGKTYKFVVSRINYKLNPNDLRYKRFLTEISSPVLRFH